MLLHILTHKRDDFLVSSINDVFTTTTSVMLINFYI